MVAEPVLPDFTSQTASAYKANIDAGFSVLQRLAWAFAPHEEAVPAMTVRLEAGAIFDGTTLSEVAPQSTAAIAAPTVNPRIDRVVIDRATGAVSVVTGTEAASPTPPAIPGNVVPIAQVALVVGQTSIVNADITDERDFGLLGLGSAAPLNVGTSAGEVVQLDGSAKLPAVDGSQLTNVGDQVARNNILLNAFRIAINGGLSVLNMQDGIVDEFEDETGVDTAGSTGEVYDAAGDFYVNSSETQVAQAAGTAIGDMIGGGGLAAAFDGNNAQPNSLGANVAGTVGLCGKDWGAATTRRIGRVKTWGANDNNVNGGYCAGADPTVTITLQGSTDNFSASIVDLGNVSFTDTQLDTPQDFTASDISTEYRYHRVKIDNSGAGSQVNLAEVEFWEAAAAAMTLISNAFTAEATPTEGRIVLFEEDIEVPVLNTDLKAFVSRDGGTTFTQITLADEGDYQTGQRILAGTADISGQPAGTSMKYKIELTATALLRLHGVALQWS